MIQIHYTPGFVRLYRKLPLALREEIKEKIEMFKNSPHQASLKVHKLKGKMGGYFSFSVNYRYRVVFMYDAKNVVALLAVGDHSIYE